LPHVEALFQQTLKRTGLNSIEQISGMEVHDCFNITEYKIVDHSGLYAPGEAWKAIDNGDTQVGGGLPINASGGLIGQGHPVGATGIRVLLDCAKETTHPYDGLQIPDAGDLLTTITALKGSRLKTILALVDAALEFGNISNTPWGIRRFQP